LKNNLKYCFWMFLWWHLVGFLFLCYSFELHSKELCFQLWWFCAE
jgi:hypothetical protein